MIEYKGYIGIVEFDPEIDLFHGTVLNTNDVITFVGTSVAELRQEMQTSIEQYIEFCQEEGKEPEQPFSDTTEYLLSSEANRKHLTEAIKNVENRKNLILITPSQWCHLIDRGNHE